MGDNSLMGSAVVSSVTWQQKGLEFEYPAFQCAHLVFSLGTAVLLPQPKDVRWIDKCKLTTGTSARGCLCLCMGPPRIGWRPNQGGPHLSPLGSWKAGTHLWLKQIQKVTDWHFSHFCGKSGYHSSMLWLTKAWSTVYGQLDVLKVLQDLSSILKWLEPEFDNIALLDLVSCDFSADFWFVCRVIH